MHFCIKLTYRIWQYPNALDACTTAYKVFSFDVIVLRLHIHRTCLMTMVIIIIIKEKQWFRKRTCECEEWCQMKNDAICLFVGRKCIYFSEKKNQIKLMHSQLEHNLLLNPYFWQLFQRRYSFYLRFGSQLRWQASNRIRLFLLKHRE